MGLPSLDESPKHNVDCCLSLSTRLISTLKQLVSPYTASGIVLSIGSGSGLLESLLLESWPTDDGSVRVEGVEVSLTTSQPVNKFLPEEAINHVHGTWEISARIEAASVLLFVYPRDPVLVTKYLDTVTQNRIRDTLIIWLGPKVDWSVFEPCFRGSANLKPIEIVNDVGLMEYEMLAKTSTTAAAR